MHSATRSHFIIREFGVKVDFKLAELIVQIVDVHISLREDLQLLQPVLEEVGLFGFGSKHQEIFLVLIPVVVVGRRYDDHPSGILVNLDGMLLVVVVL